jgi:hypothetical protein
MLGVTAAESRCDQNMSELQTFCRQVRARSAEHRQAIEALRALPGQMVSILRQELDSLVRVVFLLSQKDRQYRSRLIADTVSGRRWTRSDARQPITDREMVDLAGTLHGWTKSVYTFGCAFIHLSHLHDYRARDPLKQISEAERTAILGHLRYYHGGPGGDAPSFADVVPMLPAVFEKIASNLECYVIQLEDDGDLEREGN